MKLNEQSKKAFGPDLMELPNVHAVAPGKKISGNILLDADCVTVFVTRKVSAFRLNEDEIVPLTIGGVRTDVVEMPMMQAIRPVPATPRWVHRKVGGTSIGHFDITAGTAGILVVEKATGKLGILSNAHVLANVNKGEIGDAILWPGLFDGGTEKVAKLTRSPHIYMVDEAGPSPEPPPSGCSPIAAVLARIFNRPVANYATVLNRVDCAFAELLPGTAFESGIESIGTVAANMPAEVGQLVHKYGRTTNLQSGHIAYKDVLIDVSYGSHGVARFDGQIMISPGQFSAGGDSGSLIVTTIGTTNYAVALLFAGNGTATIANPIQEVMDTLGVTWQMI